MENGKKIDSMVEVLRPGLIMHDTKASTLQVKSMDKENSDGLTEAHIKENLKKIILTVLAFMNGQMVESMKENGKIIRCMVEGTLSGQMEESMKENIKMIKRKEMACLYGLTEGNTKVDGKTVNNMELEYI
jgi:hypothetical protein